MFYRDNFAYTGNWTELDEYLPSAYSGWFRKQYFIELYSMGFVTAASNQRYTVFAYPLDQGSLRLSTFIIMDDAIPLTSDFLPKK